MIGLLKNFCCSLYCLGTRRGNEALVLGRLGPRSKVMYKTKDKEVRKNEWGMRATLEGLSHRSTWLSWIHTVTLVKKSPISSWQKHENSQTPLPREFASFLHTAHLGWQFINKIFRPVNSGRSDCDREERRDFKGDKSKKSAQEGQNEVRRQCWQTFNFAPSSS